MIYLHIFIQSSVVFLFQYIMNSYIDVLIDVLIY